MCFYLVVLSALSVSVQSIAWKDSSGKLPIVEVPTSPGKSWIYFSIISRTWKVLESEIGAGKSWKLKCRVLQSPGIYCGSN